MLLQQRATGCNFKTLFNVTTIDNEIAIRMRHLFAVAQFHIFFQVLREKILISVQRCVKAAHNG